MPDITINGHRLHYREVGQGEPMLCWSCSIFDNAEKSWVGPMPETGAEGSGYRLIMPDFRGMAGNAHATDVAPADWVEDVRGLMDALSIPSAVIVAENLGTRVAVRLAASYPERVKALILTASIAGSDPAGDAWRLGQLDMSAWGPERAERLQLFHGDDWPAVVEWYKEFHHRDDFRSYYDLRAIAHKVKAPTLLMRGDIDTPLHKIAHSTDLHRLIEGSWLRIFPNMPYDCRRGDPDEFWRQVQTFLAERAPKG